MNPRRLYDPRIQGFTLVETLMVMVVLGIASVVIVNLSGSLFMGKTANRAIVEGAQLMQQCAEQILAIPRSGASINTVTTNSCNTVPGGSTNVSIQLYCNGGSSPLTDSPASCTSCSTTCEIAISGGNLASVKLLQLYRY